MTELMELYKQKATTEKELETAKFKIKYLESILGYQASNTPRYYADTIELSDAKGKEKWLKANLEVINEKIKKKECSFRQLVGCSKCSYSGNCYEEEQVLKDKIAKEFIRSLKEAHKPPTPEELFRKAIAVVGE